MRIAQLQLMAYGPFRGLDLDLSKPGIHVVFGRNEAGKSTTLRAITGLLYGIADTADAHVHKPADLRIGGLLVGADGKELRVVRRKGASKTLLDENGQPLDDDVLSRMLHGVTRATFQNAFGLDLGTLQLGAKALLAGGGDVGGSLFDASVGGGGDARRLLEQLTAEADAVYKPRGSTLPLNEALKAFTEAKRGITETERLPKAFVDQEEALESGKKRRAELAAERKELAHRRGQIARARQRIPLERKLSDAKAVLAALGAVALHATRIASLGSRLASYERAVIAHRDETVASERLRERIAEAARRAGVPAGSKELRTDVRTQSRIQKYLQERTTHLASLEAGRAEIARDERELARQRANVLPDDTVDAVAKASLERAVEQARKLGDLTARHATEVARAARRRAELEAKAAAAGVFDGTLEELVALRPPSSTLLDDLAARAAAAERALSRQVDRLGTLEAQLLTLEQELAQASGDFAPPTQADLRGARDARDDAWARVRDARSGEIDAKAIAAFERAVRDADVLADRMIVEADRVTTLARLRAQQATIVQQRAQAAAEHDALVTQRGAIDAEHAELWSKAGIAPGSRALGLSEMRAWLAKHAQLVDAFAAVREAEHDAAESARMIAATRDDLAAALAAASPTTTTTPAKDRSLIELLDVATARLTQIDVARRAAADTASAISKLESQLEERRALASRDEAALAEARSKLADLVSPLGIPDDADADEVNRALEALRELFGLEDQRAEVESRSAAAAAEARTFEEDAARAATELAPDLAALPVTDIVGQLAARCAKAVAAQQTITDAEAQLATIEGGAISDDVAALVAEGDGASRALEELDAKLEELESEHTKETHSIARLEVGLDQMRKESGASDQAALAQEALGRVRANVERYVRARVGSVILAREIERYREENQGPMLTTASQLFARLTLGRYSGVRAGYNDKDKVVLKCVRDGNVEVDIEGLSEGTRDQLYLSLRLASLLRYADLAEPMPLVLDDVFIQFDDERSRAALEIVAELSTRMQVLFFTHHARLVDLATAAVPSSALTVHELSSTAASVPGLAGPAGEQLALAPPAG